MKLTNEDVEIARRHDLLIDALYDHSHAAAVNAHLLGKTMNSMADAGHLDSREALKAMQLLQQANDCHRRAIEAIRLAKDRYVEDIAGIPGPSERVH